MKNFLTHRSFNHRNWDVELDLRMYYHIYHLVPHGEHKTTLTILKNQLITSLDEYERVLKIIDESFNGEMEDIVKAYLFKLMTVIKEYTNTVTVLTN